MRLYVKLTLFLLSAAAVFGQLPPKQSVTVALANTPTTDTAKEMTTLVRTVGQVTNVSYDETRNSFSLTGFEHQLGLAAWLLHAAEKSVDSNGYVMEADLPIDSRTPVTRVHYLRNSERANYQEILTLARVVGEIQFASGGVAPPMIAFRGTSAQAQLGDWLATNLDVPAGTGYSSFPLGTEDIVRIFFLNAGTQLPAVLDLREKVRRAMNTNRIFNKTSPPAIVVRGTASELSEAQKMIGAASQ